uniref:Uncharacterized protein n=1 Tax=Periophthalmus magnuspinnatus TaxID=409849 RepID=A0A3B4A9D8_9GOBI
MKIHWSLVYHGGHVLKITHNRQNISFILYNYSLCFCCKTPHHTLYKFLLTQALTFSHISLSFKLSQSSNLRRRLCWCRMFHRHLSAVSFLPDKTHRVTLRSLVSLYNTELKIYEEAADRVFMAARLFVRLFNKRGGSLQQKILELLAMADAADSFHKKTVTASVGGGVASVAGSITTITGLILAPFTAGTSLIVTAVGIGVATAGGLTSASANITDTVHSKTDRKKVEKMIQDYQDEIKDIKDCLDFLQVKNTQGHHLNQNVKHVVKEGGRAGKALVINTESLINTVQVDCLFLKYVAGGAAKAAQVMSVTTGVMSGLFLALDVFFLAKDSIELKQGAKTDFAAKIREVCKDLQNGLHISIQHFRSRNHSHHV